jgi:hypothetical protein
MVEKNGKLTEEAITENENCHNLAGISKIDQPWMIMEKESRQNLSISRKSTINWRLLKMTNRPRLQARAYTRTAIVKQSSLLANVGLDGWKLCKSQKQSTGLNKSMDEISRAILSPVRSVVYRIF